jgi:UDPglucose 6-dehydrogenase
MKITIAGAGYVGLVAGACYATSGNHVIVADIDSDKVDALNRGEIPIYEPGLEDLVQDGVAAGRLKFTTDLASACKDAAVIGIAVGTPSAPDGTADLQYVRDVAETIGRSIENYAVVVTKSTVPVGTHAMVTDTIRSQTDVDFDYASNPEFLKEGSAVNDFLKPERVIIGSDSDRARKIMSRLYSPFMRQGRRILFMDTPSAELTKYACNSMLAVRISFMNEIARLAEAVGADVHSVRMGMGSDSRIGRSFLFPGLGYGGSCFPKDVQALIRTGELTGLDMGIVAAAERANRTQPDLMVQKIRNYFDGDLQGKQFAVWGLAFKPKTDDMREAPSLKIVEQLLADGASVRAYDPQARETTREILGDRISYADQPYDALNDADALIVCTEWLEFHSPDFEQIAKAMKTKVIFDGRNLYDIEYVTDFGFDYFCIGRPDSTKEEE